MHEAPFYPTKMLERSGVEKMTPVVLEDIRDTADEICGWVKVYLLEGDEEAKKMAEGHLEHLKDVVTAVLSMEPR